MRVLLINNDVGAGGGAQTVTATTAGVLAQAGHDVTTLAAPAGRRAGIYSPACRRAVARAVARRRPDVAHVHNVYERLTLSVVDALHAARVPTVMTLHDYRAVCPNGILLAPDGQCRRCVTGTPAHAVRLACLHGSRCASARAAAEVLLNRSRGAYHRIDVLVSPSEHLAAVMRLGGLPADRIAVVRNAVHAAPAPRGPAPGAPEFVFAARLTPAKGLATLVDAARRLGDRARITVLGAGRSAQRLQEAARGLPIELRGLADHADVHAALAGATAALVPSIWVENCPLAILEAAAVGVPAIASDLGTMRELIDDGVDGILFPPGDGRALAAAIVELAEDRALAAELGAAAWRRVRERHAPDAYRDAIVACYARARWHSGGAGGRASSCSASASTAPGDSRAAQR
ncbi:MAG TPA: glycosyltransferase [Solirubrobacteraceae bacterium]|nr:glycosyltransferase [Solirubrobacteraceae bacterium]